MTEIDVTANANRNFILQQGLEAPEPASCTRLSSALLFQTRLVGVILVAGTISQSSVLFATLASEFRIVAWVLQAIFLVAVAAMVFGRFCLGSFVYHVVRGRVAFAVGTLPWSRAAERER
jgi:hypothetical protein